MGYVRHLDTRDLPTQRDREQAMRDLQAHRPVRSLRMFNLRELEALHTVGLLSATMLEAEREIRKAWAQ